MNKSMQETNMINKPITILREEFVTSMVSLINNSGLPLFYVEPILRDMLMDVNTAVKKQYEMEKAQYEQAIRDMDGGQDDRGKISEEITENSTEK